MKKVLSFLLALCMALSFAGCKKEEASSKSVETITYWTFNSHDKDIMTQIIDNFNKTDGAKLGVKINYVIKSDMSASMIDLGYTSGQAPDLFETCDFNKFTSEGKIIAYEDLPGGEEYIKQFDGMLRETVNTLNGKTYTVIRKYGATTRALLYNKDMFKAAGIVDENGEAKPPKTYDELREDAKKLTNASKGKYGIILPMKWATFFENDVRSLMQTDIGHMGYDPVAGKYDYSGLKPVMEMYVGLKKDKSYFPGAETLDNDSARARFAEGDIGMKFGASYDYGVLTSQFPAKCDWGVAPLPALSENPEYKQIYTLSYTPYINSGLLDRISPETIMEVLKFLNSDQIAAEQYKNGKGLPIDSSIVENTKLDKDMENWKNFASLSEISTINPVSRKFDVSKYQSFSDRFINEIWNEGGSIDKLLSEYAALVNKEIDAYQELHPEYNGNQFILDKWDTRRK